jgi:curved DNA-binding protein CbpA
MPDHFAALDQPRRPWLDAAVLRECFHRSSAKLHPDVPGTGDAARFAALNAAYTVLRDPAARARHLLELEAPDLPAAATAPPPAFGDLFMRQAAIHQRLAAFRAKHASVSNPLARALLTDEEAALRHDAEAAQSALDTEHASALEDLRALDSRWSAGDETRFAQLADIQRRLTFLGKWRAQLREALFALGA